MIATLTIGGAAMPLTQATLRRSADAASLSLQIAGPQVIATSAAVLLVVDGVTISGSVTEFSIGDKSTSCSADVTPAIGTGVYAPKRIHFRSTGTVRGDVYFSILPGDTYAGMVIKEATHTIGSTSPSFSEVRF